MSNPATQSSFDNVIQSNNLPTSHVVSQDSGTNPTGTNASPGIALPSDASQGASHGTALGSGLPDYSFPILYGNTDAGFKNTNQVIGGSAGTTRDYVRYPLEEFNLSDEGRDVGSIVAKVVLTPAELGPLFKRGNWFNSFMLWRLCGTSVSMITNSPKGTSSGCICAVYVPDPYSNFVSSRSTLIELLAIPGAQVINAWDSCNITLPEFEVSKFCHPGSGDLRLTSYGTIYFIVRQMPTPGSEAGWNLNLVLSAEFSIPCPYSSDETVTEYFGPEIYDDLWKLVLDERGRWTLLQHMNVLSIGRLDIYSVYLFSVVVTKTPTSTADDNVTEVIENFSVSGADIVAIDGMHYARYFCTKDFPWDPSELSWEMHVASTPASSSLTSVVPPSTNHSRSFTSLAKGRVGTTPRNNKMLPGLSGLRFAPKPTKITPVILSKSRPNSILTNLRALIHAHTGY